MLLFPFLPCVALEKIKRIDIYPVRVSLLLTWEAKEGNVSSGAIFIQSCFFFLFSPWLRPFLRRINRGKTLVSTLEQTEARKFLFFPLLFFCPTELEVLPVPIFSILVLVLAWVCGHLVLFVQLYSSTAHLLPVSPPKGCYHPRLCSCCCCQYSHLFFNFP